MYKTLILSGGGYKGFSHIGALYELFDKGYLNYIQRYVGTSIGSMISLLLCIGMTPLEIYNFSYQISYNTSSLDNILTDYGIYDPESVTKPIENLLMSKFNKIPNMEELYNLTKKELYITVTNVSKAKVEYINYKDYPDFDVIKAIQGSIAIPLIFKRVRYKDEIYVDGGILDNFPVGLANGHTIGINLSCLYQEDDFFSYILKIIDLNTIIQKKPIPKDFLYININIPRNIMSSKERLFTYGREQVVGITK